MSLKRKQPYRQKLESVKKINIAVDGYSSCGKGTLAKYLAQKLDYIFIDSGAMYRAVTLFVLRKGISIENELEVAALLPQIKIEFANQHNAGSIVLLNGEDVETEIRSMQVAQNVSAIAKLPAVRLFLVALQREMGKNKGVVMDGRDIGTVVFPDAELKIFMTAKPEIRAKRRFEELSKSGVHTTYEAVFQNISERDRIDTTREDSPLQLTASYTVLDNSTLTIQEQNEMAVGWVNIALGK